MSDNPTERPEPLRGGIPTDPDELEEWKARFTEELLDHPGGVDAPWRQSS